MQNKEMGNNEGSVDKTLQQRGNIYGSYADVVQDRKNILEIITSRYHRMNGKPMPEELQIMFGDLVLKLVRASSDPLYTDSLHDLQGYAKLMEDAIKKGLESGYYEIRD